MKGSILKLKAGTSTNQLFVMIISDINEEKNYVYLYDNIMDSIIGDITKGINLDDFELSSIEELSDFIKNK